MDKYTVPKVNYIRTLVTGMYYSDRKTWLKDSFQFIEQAARRYDFDRSNATLYDKYQKH